MTRRSPHAHGPRDLCDACNDCRSCDGSRRRIPDRYRVVVHPDGAATAQCTDCDGTGTHCRNLVTELAS